MIAVDSPKWKEFVSHILSFEGGLSRDPRDNAASCVQPGQYHTNKGVTFCTFKNLAGSLGISPVNYSKFLNLTNEEVGKFIHSYYKNIKADQFSDSIGLSLTEAAWGSGPGNAAKHLQRALNKMGKAVAVDGGIGPQTIAAANSVDQRQLYSLFWEDRKRFLSSLSDFVTYGKGWMRRVESFLKSFPPMTFALSVAFIVAVMGISYYYLSTDKKVQKALENVEIPI